MAFTTIGYPGSTYVNNTQDSGNRILHRDFTACPKNSEHRMMMPLHKNVFRITAPLWGESTGHRSIPLTKGRYCSFDAHLMIYMMLA